MIKINRHNYEEFIIDYLEGNLSAKMEGAVNEFFRQNPDIKSEAEELFDIKLNLVKTEYDNKSFLKKNPNYDIEGITRFEQLSVAFLEGDISLDEQSQLNEMINRSQKKWYEHHVIQKTIVRTNVKIVFRQKAKLKHYQLSFYRKRVYYIISIAASIALVLGILFNYNRVEENALVLNGFQTKLKSPRSAVHKYVIAESVESFKLKKTIQIDIDQKEEINDVKEEIIDHSVNSIASINSKTLERIDEHVIEGNKVITEELSVFIQNEANDISYVNENEIEEYINNKYLELGLEPPAKDKSFLSKIGKASSEFLNKTFRKRFGIKKITAEDGRRLYAVKAGSIEFYANLKGTKDNDKPKKNNE